MSSRRAFTIIELAVSSAVVALIMGSVVSVMALAARAIPTSAPAENDLAPALARLAEELGEARTIRSIAADGVTFTIADRDADASPDVIRYDWPGAGSPLYVTRPGRPRAAVTPALDQARFGATKASVSETAPDTIEKLPSSELASNTGSNGGVTLAPGTLIGQYFRPSLPSEALSWSLERIDVSMSRLGIFPSQFEASIYRADGDGRPTDTAVDAESLSFGLLSLGFGYQSLDLVAQDLDPQQGLCLVMSTSVSVASTNLSYANEGAATMALIVSSDGGTSWVASTVASITFRAYGTMIVRVPGGTATREFVDRVEIELTPAGSDRSLRATVSPSMGVIVE